MRKKMVFVLSALALALSSFTFSAKALSAAKQGACPACPYCGPQPQCTQQCNVCK